MKKNALLILFLFTAVFGFSSGVFESDLPIISLDHKLLELQGRKLAPHIGFADLSAG
ncbi:MAG: hypothetical protein PQJ61_15060 [Spirochaetales bacterium]|uniref:Uncharacterized protein n=1 Tax=Candidatus Thalassospirochaeta sargassi TaxID=3119039 RepID=A0AAJ1ILA9_9SPIO|nr:hypothetical protein [Spirochaetales bacterium]